MTFYFFRIISVPEDMFFPMSSFRSKTDLYDTFLSYDIDTYANERVRALFVEGEEKGYCLYPEGNAVDRCSDTQAFLQRIACLLSKSPVYFILANAAGRSSHVPIDLHWLSVDVISKKMHVVDVPTCASLVGTLYEANQRGECSYRMQAELILIAPYEPNANQLQIVKRIFGDSARHHFTYMEAGVIKRFTDLSYVVNFSMRIVRGDSDQPCSVALMDNDAQVCLYRQNIDYLMQPLKSNLAVATPSTSSASSTPQCMTEDDVSDRIIALNVYRCSLDTKEWGDFSESTSASSCVSAILNKIDKLQKSTKPCLPPVTCPKDLSSILNRIDRKSTKPYLPSVTCPKDMRSDYLLFTAECNPHLLCLFTQKDFADWFLSAGIDKLSTFTQILLSKARRGEPYTLPATQELISDIRIVLLYLLDTSSQRAAEPLRSIVQEATYSVYASIRASISAEDKAKVKMLYNFCRYLRSDAEVHLARSGLKEHFNIPLSSTHNIAYAPEEVVCIINLSLNVISQLFCKYADSKGSRLHLDNYTRVDESNVVNNCLLLFFMHKSYLTVEHRVKSWPLSAACLEFSLDYHNSRSGMFMFPKQLWIEDYFFQSYKDERFLFANWVAVMHEERKFLFRYIESVATLLKSTKQSFTTLSATLSSSDLLKVFNALQVLLFTASATAGASTNTHVRVLPLACDRSYHEKKSKLFRGANAVMLEEASELRLDEEFKFFSSDLKQLLPIGTNSSVPYFMACLLFDATLKQAQCDVGKEKPVDAGGILQAFQKTLAIQDYYIRLFEKSWNILISKEILPGKFSRIQDPVERLRVLCLPNIQELLFYAKIDWDLEAVTRQGNAA